MKDSKLNTITIHTNFPERVRQLEALLWDFIECVEVPTVRTWWEEGAVDLIYLYSDACAALNHKGQPVPTVDIDLEVWEETGEE